MKININGIVKDYPAIWREKHIIKMIDQRLLPHKVEIIELENHRDIIEAIKDMAVRGAPAIGVAAGYGVAQAALEAKDKNKKEFQVYVIEAANSLRATRPTAVNLFHAIDRVEKKVLKNGVKNPVRVAFHEADAIAKESHAASKRIGEYGNTLIEDGDHILTHCNAGSLAFIDEGSAIAPIRAAHRKGKSVFVFVDETRPRCQGAKLTAWELQQEGIPYALIVDNAAGFYMHRGNIDLVIVGADRIAANGDTANKIGTYEKAVLAMENSIPFYVAAPLMTFDITCETGDNIEIEERSPHEINWVRGVDINGKFTEVRVSAEGTPALNPSFDVTPAKYITAFITEKKIIYPPFEKKIKSII